MTAVLVSATFAAACVYAVWEAHQEGRSGGEMLLTGVALVVVLWGAAAIVRALRRPKVVVVESNVQRVVHYQADGPPPEAR